jgi:hypothetical protein
MAKFTKAAYGVESEGGFMVLNLDEVLYVKVGRSASGMTDVTIGYPSGPITLGGQSADHFLEVFSKLIGPQRVEAM